MKDCRPEDSNRVWDRLDYEHDAMIEASAGTGKTYALENIVLKLVKEKQYDAKSILLVTYTEKAAGELKDRIRKALTAEAALPPDFDEMTICTIHSFCRQLLTEYAFENGVPMKSEIGGDIDSLARKAVLDALDGEDFREKFGGNLYSILEKANISSVSALVEKVKRTIKSPDCEKKCAAMEADVASGRKNAETRKKELLLRLTRPALARFAELKKSASFMTFDDIVERAAEVVAKAPGDEAGRIARQRLFDSIRKRYRVALVDEFQDTDEKQWGIFKTLFSSESGQPSGAKPGFLIVVGDPKQAIYSFRGADVEVYCNARKEIAGDGGSKILRLDKTYRSKKPLVNAFNIFFRNGREGKPGADWFRDSAAGTGIEYEDVGYPEENAKFAGLREAPGQEAAVMLLESMPDRIKPSGSKNGAHFGNKSACLPVFMENAAREMLYLKSLDPAYTTVAEKPGPDGSFEKKRTFSFGDMCVLVESRADAAAARRILSRHGIPYGQYKQQGLYDSSETEGVLALLDYLSEPAGSGNRAALLLSPVFGVHPSDLQRRTAEDEEKFDSLMETLLGLAREKDWNAVFERVMSDGSTALAHPSGDVCAFNRTRAAVRQIFDALLSDGANLAQTPSALAAKLREWRANDKAAGEDGAIYRRESDSDRVQIMTMHASKGLQFPVVFLAYGFSNQVKTGTPREERPTAREERRRLLYVALTRAEHRLYLPWSRRAWHWEVESVKADGRKIKIEGSGIGSSDSALLSVRAANGTTTTGFLGRAIEVYFEDDCDGAFPPERHAARRRTGAERPCGATDSPPGRKSEPRAIEDACIPALKNRRVQWDSFSSIHSRAGSGKANPEKKEIALADAPQRELSDGANPLKTDTETALPRGTVSGNVFHEIMEELCGNDAGAGEVDFSNACDPEMAQDESPLAVLIRRKMRQNLLPNREKAGTTTEKTLLRMVQTALSTPVKIGAAEFRLKDIARKDRLAEVAFVAGEKQLLGLPDRDGAMNGKIDLLVRAGGKVFILDWKTNSLPDYGRQSVEDAMDEAGYHLQYKIYSLAAAGWLKSCGLVPGGAAYLFVRGGETGGQSGVFAREFDRALVESFRDDVAGTGAFAAGGEKG